MVQVVWGKCSESELISKQTKNYDVTVEGHVSSRRRIFIETCIQPLALRRFTLRLTNVIHLPVYFNSIRRYFPRTYSSCDLDCGCIGRMGVIVNRNKLYCFSREFSNTYWMGFRYHNINNNILDAPFYVTNVECMWGKRIIIALGCEVGI